MLKEGKGKSYLPDNMNIETKTIYIDSKKGTLDVAQFSDLHLGTKIADFNKINSLTGNYFQWDDQIEALRKATQLVVEQNPAVAIYPGDIFDRPSNISEKLLAAFQESVLSLIKNDIAVVMFTGNHDFPKSREYKALISRYDGIGEYLNIVPVYKAQYEKISINDEILIHCIPQCFSKEQFKLELDKVGRDDNYPINILTTHIGIQGAGLSEYEHAEAWLNKVELDMDFDYIALGDYHRPIKVTDKCGYAGVLCKGNFADKDSKHGIIVFKGKEKEIHFFEYQVRGMEQFNINCSDLSVADIDDKLSEIHEIYDKEKYIKIELLGISRLKQKQLDFKHIHSMRKNAYYCKVSYIYSDDNNDNLTKNESEGSTIKPISEEVQEHLGILIEDNSDLNRLYNIYDSMIRKQNV